MARRSTGVCLPASTAIFFFVLAVSGASAADLTGKWYLRLNSEPIITINKAGPAYTASLDYPDTAKSVLMANGMPDWPQSIHKDITSFNVAGNIVRFTIRNTISRGGDTNTIREEYQLSVSADGHQMNGTVTRMGAMGTGFSGAPVPTSVTPITLYSTEFVPKAQR